ncbi:hypothetical protein F4778DRAFT_686920 [Xylariomycetidae sp. FL2044]|nr:hypothetical protein F4778DRAFT_686920 [Xylariomycetidae sp. FL2044]
MKFCDIVASWALSLTQWTSIIPPPPPSPTHLATNNGNRNEDYYHQHSQRPLTLEEDNNNSIHTTTTPSCARNRPLSATGSAIELVLSRITEKIDMAGSSIALLSSSTTTSTSTSTSWSRTYWSSLFAAHSECHDGLQQLLRPSDDSLDDGFIDPCDLDILTSRADVLMSNISHVVAELQPSSSSSVAIPISLSMSMPVTDDDDAGEETSSPTTTTIPTQKTTTAISRTTCAAVANGYAEVVVVVAAEFGGGGGMGVCAAYLDTLGQRLGGGGDEPPGNIMNAGTLLRSAAYKWRQVVDGYCETCGVCVSSLG